MYLNYFLYKVTYNNNFVCLPPARGQGGLLDETNAQFPAMAAPVLQAARAHFILRQGERRE
ncbi:hypothetical protein HW555_008827 [Spodoptera exigua]|uniref:Uncharacterized protein n=1 Tax=Spodoptera exigua TaxID=7107 RepID=A0A835GA25_SPOEX|nr:hypothetical protein HW555_008827 [Spodoptera exigua]